MIDDVKAALPGVHVVDYPAAAGVVLATYGANSPPTVLDYSAVRSALDAAGIAYSEAPTSDMSIYRWPITTEDLVVLVGDAAPDPRDVEMAALKAQIAALMAAK